MPKHTCLVPNTGALGENGWLDGMVERLEGILIAPCYWLFCALCVHVLILNICMFCDRIRLKGKLAKRQSIKIDGILKFTVSPPNLILVSLALMVFCNLGFGIQPVFVFSFLVIY